MKCAIYILKCLCYVHVLHTVHIYHAQEVRLQAMQIASVRTVDVIVLGVEGKVLLM